jgi:hypothetical protein
MLWIYVTVSQNGYYYVGSSTDVESRYLQHVEGAGRGSAWTRAHKPSRIVETVPNATLFDEIKYTLIYMDKYGVKKVRGGVWVQVQLSPSDLTDIQRHLNMIRDTCFRCGGNHFIKDCPDTQGTAMRCTRCERTSHNSDRCFAKTHQDGSPLITLPSSSHTPTTHTPVTHTPITHTPTTHTPITHTPARKVIAVVQVAVRGDEYAPIVVRDAPSTDGKVISSIFYGENIQVYQILDGWIEMSGMRYLEIVQYGTPVIKQISGERVSEFVEGPPNNEPQTIIARLMVDYVGGVKVFSSTSSGTCVGMIRNGDSFDVYEILIGEWVRTGTSRYVKIVDRDSVVVKQIWGIPVSDWVEQPQPQGTEDRMTPQGTEGLVNDGETCIVS